METYLLKSSISLVILYALYRIMLHYEFNHQLNRMIGLTCVLFSMSFPIVQFNAISQGTLLPVTVYTIAAGTADLQEKFSSAIPETTWSIFSMVYGIGTCLFSLRVLIGLLTLLGFYFNSPRDNRWGFVVVTLPGKMSPFTFFNILFVGNNNTDDVEMEAMLLHEQAHRNQYHSIDAVLLEVLTVIFWFNPVIWLFRRDIKAQHEYFADEQVLKKGINTRDYQHILFKTQTGTSVEVANYLSNTTSLTKRFNMMTQPRSNSKTMYWRASLFFILMSVILCFSAFSDLRENIQVDTPPVYEQGREALIKTVQKQLKYPSSARRENRTGRVHVSFTVSETGDVVNIEADKGKEGYAMQEIVIVGYYTSTETAKGIDDVLRNEAMRVVATLGKFIPAEKDGKPVKSVVILPIKFLLE
jgi:hypothetical protein